MHIAARKHGIGLVVLVTTLLAGCASTVDDPRHANVEVQFAEDVWRNDSRNGAFDHESSRRAAEVALRKHLMERAGQMLPEGKTLAVTFTQIERAGAYEPWHGPAAQDVRIVRDIYPPRIDLTFSLSNADGRTLKAGNSQLRDSAFLLHANRYPNDPLRFEKALLDDWVRRELPSKK